MFPAKKERAAKPFRHIHYLYLSQRYAAFKFALGLLLAFYSGLLQTQRRRGEKPFLEYHPNLVFIFITAPISRGRVLF